MVGVFVLPLERRLEHAATLWTRRFVFGIFKVISFLRAISAFKLFWGFRRLYYGDEGAEVQAFGFDIAEFHKGFNGGVDHSGAHAPAAGYVGICGGELSAENLTTAQTVPLLAGFVVGKADEILEALKAHGCQ